MCRRGPWAALWLGIGLATPCGASGAAEVNPGDVLLATTRIGEIRVNAPQPESCRQSSDSIADVVQTALLAAGIQTGGTAESNSGLSVVLLSRADGSKCAVYVGLKLIRRQTVPIPYGEHAHADIGMSLVEVGEIVIEPSSKLRAAMEGLAWGLATVVADEIVAAQERVRDGPPGLRDHAPRLPPVSPTGWP